MNGSLVIAVGCLVAVGTYLVTSRALSRIVLGFAMLGHAVVLAIVTAGGSSGAPPLADRVDGRVVADPLPQALSLTAIVISFGLTLFLLALALRQRQISGDDLVEDDLEDRRIATQRDEASPSSESPSSESPSSESPSSESEDAS